MSYKAAFVLLLAGLFMVPFGQAATTIEAPTTNTTIPYGGSGSVSLNVTVDCQDFITGMGAVNRVLTVEGPSWLSSDGATASFDGTACITGLPGTSLSQTVTIPLSASAEAPGMSPADVTVTSDDGATATFPVQATYKMGYEFIHDAPEMIELGHDPFTFNATLHLFGNARSMAMFNFHTGPDFVSVSGLPTFKTVGDDQLAGPLESTTDLTVTVTPPETGEWEADTMCFTTWSHFLDDGNAKTPDEEVCWNFSPSDHHEEDESEGSPGFGVGLMVIGLLGAAAFVARRH